jgi:flagellar basal-body rod protein FlgC
MEREGMSIGGLAERGGGFRSFFRSMGIAASGLSAQRARIETIAENLANAETTRTAEGTPYRRKVVDLQEFPFQKVLGAQGAQGAQGAHGTQGAQAVRGPSLPGGAPDPRGQGEAGGVRVAGILEDVSQGPMVYDPGHPHADENGYVEMPNVSVTEEMVRLMEARRLYEANASVFDAVKSMLRRGAEL